MNSKMMNKVFSFLLAFAVAFTTIFTVPAGAATVNPRDAKLKGKIKSMTVRDGDTIIEKNDTVLVPMTGSKELTVSFEDKSESKPATHKVVAKVAKKADKKKATVTVNYDSELNESTITIAAGEKAEEGKAINVTVKSKAKKVKKLQFKVQFVSAVPVTGVTLDKTTPKVGDTITATVTPKDATNIVSCQWTVNGTAVEGATEKTFTVPSTCVLGDVISFVVTDDEGKTFEPAEKATVKVDEDADLAITAEQTGATTIKVTANKPVATTDSVVVTRGTSTVSSSFVVDSVGTTITITTGIKLADAEYTITVTPADTTKKAATTTLTGKTATLDSIDFVGENLILADSTYKQASVKIFGYNSFGEEVALSTLTPYTSKGDVEYKASDNEIIIKATGTALFQTGEQITVTAVYQDGTTVKQVAKALTVSAAATLSEISFSELKTSNTALEGKRVDLTNMSSGTYYKEVEAKDQYGNVLNATKLNSMLYTSTHPEGTLFATPSQADGAYVYLTGFDTTTDKKTIAKYTLGALEMPGTQTFTYTAVGGYSASDSIEVVDDSYIATLSLEIPELYGEKESEVVVTAVDQYDEAVDLYNVANADTIDRIDESTSQDYEFKGQNSLTKSKAKITVPAGLKLKVTKNTSKKTVKFTITPKANNTSSNVQYVVIAQSATPTINNYTCAVQPNANIYGIATSLKSGGTSITVKNGTTADLAANVNILDQYGAVIKTAKELDDAGLTIDASTKVASDSYTGGTQTDGTFIMNFIDKSGNLVANASSVGAGTYTVSLWKLGSKTDTTDQADNNSKLAERTFTVIVGESTYESYSASIAEGDELLYVGDGTNATLDTASLVVKGTDAKKNTVKLSEGTDYTLTVDSNDVLVVDGNKIKLNTAVETNGFAASTKVEGTATISVWANGEEVATTTLNYSNAAPTPKSIYAAKSIDGTKWEAFADTEISLKNGIFMVAPVVADASAVADALVYDNTSAAQDSTHPVYKLGVHDQYGLPFIGQSAAFAGDELPAAPTGGAGYIAEGKTKTLKVTGGTLNQSWSIVNNKTSGDIGTKPAGATSVGAISAIVSSDLHLSTISLTAATVGKVYLNPANSTTLDEKAIDLGTVGKGASLVTMTSFTDVEGIDPTKTYYTVFVPDDTVNYSSAKSSSGQTCTTAAANYVGATNETRPASKTESASGTLATTASGLGTADATVVTDPATLYVFDQYGNLVKSATTKNATLAGTHNTTGDYTWETGSDGKLVVKGKNNLTTATDDVVTVAGCAIAVSVTQGT